MALDYKKFLNKGGETLVLPYLGGTRVDAADRRLRVETSSEQPIAHGWWSFQVDGRTAVPKEQTSPPDLSALPAVRGHYVSGWVVVDGRQLHRLSLPPEDEPAPLSRITARRWYSGDMLFDTTEFEDDAETSARQALEERRALGDTKGVVPSLRAAFAYAVGLDVARELDAQVTPGELTGHVVAIADQGREVVVRMFHALLEARMREAEEARRRAEAIVRAARERAEAAEQAARLEKATASARALPRAQRGGVEHRVDDVLDKARARMTSVRRLAGGSQLDVTYTVDGNRIMSIIDADTFQVLDPGICLSGAHRVLTLDAMPSVVREAIEERHLNITRR